MSFAPPLAIALTAFASAALALFGSYLYACRRPEYDKRSDLVSRDGFLRWVDEYEKWYTRSAWALNWTFFCCKTMPLVLGFLVAIISALPEGFEPFAGIPRNILVIALTGLSTLCVAVLTQLGVAERARAREIGRIGVAKLAAESRVALSGKKEIDDQTKAQLVSITDRIFEIEFDQQALFAAAFGDPKASKSKPAGPKDRDALANRAAEVPVAPPADL